MNRTKYWPSLPFHRQGRYHQEYQQHPKVKEFKHILIKQLIIKLWNNQIIPQQNPKDNQCIFPWICLLSLKTSYLQTLFYLQFRYSTEVSIGTADKSIEKNKYMNGWTNEWMNGWMNE